MAAPLFLIPVLVGLLVQFLKRYFNKDWHSSMEVHGYALPRYGGMPSAHTAFAFSLATVTALSQGIGSIAFAITFALVIFILDDALRMRVYLSRHGQALAQLIATLPADKRSGFPNLEQRLGHKPLEVLVGALVGIVLTIAIYQFVGI